MVDWDAVERLRSKGWDWDRIADDPKAGFTADSGVQDKGRALRSLYYQRRSKQQRRPSGGGGGKAAADDLRSERRWTLARAGFLFTPLFGLWTVLAWVFPSPVGAYLPAFPILVVVFLGAAAVLSFGLLRAVEKWTPVFRSTLAVGVILGLVVSGGMGLYAISQGCPTLTSATSPEPGQWNKAANPMWSSNGAPVFFYYGSVACPYCSASSWAMTYALSKFGTYTGWTYGHSAIGDTPSNVPEVIMSGSSLQSRWVALDVVESTIDDHVVAPSTSSCIEQAYVSAYGGPGIPFVVLGGQYFHTGTLVDPSSFVGVSPAVVQQQVSNQSGNYWDLIQGQAYYMMAFIVHLNGGQPTNIAQIPQVAADLTQIT